MQYTIRGISPEIDAALRARAMQNDKSLNETACEALAEGLGVHDRPKKYRDLSDIATGEPLEKEVLDALASFDKIDEEMWR